MSALDDLFGFHVPERFFLFDDAEVAERLNAPALKTGGPHGSEGSNPSFSVRKCRLGVIGSPPVPNTGNRHDLGVRVSQAALMRAKRTSSSSMRIADKVCDRSV